ncbi:Uncharacterized protein TCM_030306 [Theobroma cacao]|uniref:Uncharacterized protein n=1 Tax=Theobroma cacao TaxID=3641 RepID=A0A061GI19_THECC|nr:Uncharacterized protein TCM_030306 [Theobroma cacao]
MLMSLSLHFVGGLMAVDVDVEVCGFLSHSELCEICELARLRGGTSLPYLTTLKVCELAKQAGLIQGQVQKECHGST